MEDLKTGFEKNTTAINTSVHNLQTTFDETTTEVKSSMHNLENKMEENSTKFSSSVNDLQKEMDELRAQYQNLQAKMDLIVNLNDSVNTIQTSPSGQASPCITQTVNDHDNLNSVVNNQTKVENTIESSQSIITTEGQVSTKDQFKKSK